MNEVFALMIYKNQTIQKNMTFKKLNIKKDTPIFSHFGTLPFLQPPQKQSIKGLQAQIVQIFDQYKYEAETLKAHSHNLAHITLFKLILHRSEMKEKMKMLMEQEKGFLGELLKGVRVSFGGVEYFTRFHKNAKMNELIVIYLSIDAQTTKVLQKVSDSLIRKMISLEILFPEELKTMNIKYDHNENLYKPQTFHVSLFRCRNLMENDKFKEMYQKIVKEIEGWIQNEKFELQYFDISTMKEYQEEGFYLPFWRGRVGGVQNQQKQQKQQLQQKQQNHKQQGQQKKLKQQRHKQKEQKHLKRQAKQE